MLKIDLLYILKFIYIIFYCFFNVIIGRGLPFNSFRRICSLALGNNMCQLFHNAPELNALPIG